MYKVKGYDFYSDIIDCPEDCIEIGYTNDRLSFLKELLALKNHYPYIIFEEITLGFYNPDNNIKYLYEYNKKTNKYNYTNSWREYT